jgi:hypothetical protein
MNCSTCGSVSVTSSVTVVSRKSLLHFHLLFMPAAMNALLNKPFAPAVLTQHHDDMSVCNA